jgi:hypothetical protein
MMLYVISKLFLYLKQQSPREHTDARAYGGDALRVEQSREELHERLVLDEVFQIPDAFAEVHNHFRAAALALVVLLRFIPEKTIAVKARDVWGRLRAVTDIISMYSSILFMEA